jgi:hypothetical protein
VTVQIVLPEATFEIGMNDPAEYPVLAKVQPIHLTIDSGATVVLLNMTWQQAFELGGALCDAGRAAESMVRHGPIP